MMMIKKLFRAQERTGCIHFLIIDINMIRYYHLALPTFINCKKFLTNQIVIEYRTFLHPSCENILIRSRIDRTSVMEEKEIDRGWTIYKQTRRRPRCYTSALVRKSARDRSGSTVISPTSYRWSSDRSSTLHRPRLCYSNSTPTPTPFWNNVWRINDQAA